MNEPKPFASLSSGLLARKGTAKPAMRPQGFTHFGGGLEDLGWNDMGMGIAPADPDGSVDEPQEHVPSSIAALTPAPRPHDLEALAGETEPTEADESAPTPVELQQRAIAASFSADVPAPVIAAPAPVVRLPLKPRSAPGLKDKAAFTLRLDPSRHLKLRLACAVKHRSAQQIVTEALDEFLQSLPELDAMAGQVPARAGKQK